METATPLDISDWQIVRSILHFPVALVGLGLVPILLKPLLEDLLKPEHLDKADPLLQIDSRVYFHDLVKCFAVVVPVQRIGRVRAEVLQF